MHIETKCIHAGSGEDATTGGVNTPVFPSTAHEYLQADDVAYPRYFNTVNQKLIVQKICELEEAEDGVVFSSGMAAISTVLLSFLKTGDHAILQDEIYGGSHAFFERFGISFSLVQTNRVRQQNANAAQIATFLDDCSNIKKVYYPGLSQHPGHVIAASQMQGFGGVLAFELNTKNLSADDFMKKLSLIKPAVSLGGIETTVCDPVRTSHAHVSAEVRNRQGITDGLLRLSVGIENVEDLINDIKQAITL